LLPLRIDPAASPRELLALGAELTRRAIPRAGASPAAALRLFDALPDPPALASGEPPSPEALAALSEHFHRRLGFRGNETDYYAPENSFLDEALQRRLGIPITLSIIYMALAERAGLTIRGVASPGHFLCRCDLPGGPLFIDPFHRGRVLDETRALEFLRVTAPGLVPTSRSLLPASNPEIVRRLLANLRAIYLKKRRLDLVERVLGVMLEVTPSDADLWVERGAALAVLGRRMEAADAATRSILARGGGGEEMRDLEPRRRHLLTLLRERLLDIN
jgi:regulator of sirC expression with transglutaminase-like and TPR domain